jgi:hypothetical protein
VASSGDDGEIRLWDCRSGRLLGSCDAGATAARWLASCAGGAVLLAASGNRRVCALDAPAPAPADEPATSGADSGGPSSPGPSSPGPSSPGGSAAAEKVPALSTRVVLPEQLGSRVKSFAFDAAGTRAAVVLFDSTLSIWDLASGECTAHLIRRGARCRGACRARPPARPPACLCCLPCRCRRALPQACPAACRALSPGLHRRPRRRARRRPRAHRRRQRGVPN